MPITRRLFGTDGIRGTANTSPMTAEIALRLGQAAGLLNRLVKKHVQLSVPSLTIYSEKELRASLGDIAGLSLSAVELSYKGFISGEATLLFHKEGADALAIMTEWKQFVHPDFIRMRELMRQPVIFDGRNLYNPRRMQSAGFTYYSIGRPAV